MPVEAAAGSVRGLRYATGPGWTASHRKPAADVQTVCRGRHHPHGMRSGRTLRMSFRTRAPPGEAGSPPAGGQVHKARRVRIDPGPGPTPVAHPRAETREATGHSPGLANVSPAGLRTAIPRDHAPQFPACSICYRVLQIVGRSRSVGYRGGPWPPVDKSAGAAQSLRTYMRVGQALRGPLTTGGTGHARRATASPTRLDAGRDDPVNPATSVVGFERVRLTTHTGTPTVHRKHPGEFWTSKLTRIRQPAPREGMA